MAAGSKGSLAEACRGRESPELHGVPSLRPPEAHFSLCAVTSMNSRGVEGGRVGRHLLPPGHSYAERLDCEPEVGTFTHRK